MAWVDDRDKIRIQSFRRLVAILEFCREEVSEHRKSYGKEDMSLKEFLEEFNWYWFPVSPDTIAEQFNISRRTAQDYLLTLKAIAGFLLENWGVEREEEE